MRSWAKTLSRAGGGLALLVGAAIAVLVVTAPAAVGQAPPEKRDAAPGELRLGVVDLGKVFQEYKKSAELEKRINEEKDDLKTRLDEQRKVVENINDEMDVLDPDSETYMLKEEQRALEIARLEYMKRRLEQTIKRKWEEYNRLLIEDIDAVVKAFGEERGFTLILKVEGRELGEQQLIEIGLKSVMYFSKRIDITDEIVHILNSQHSVGGKPGQVAPKSK